MKENTVLPYALTAAVVLIAAAILLMMGRVPWCTCGIDLWGTMGTEEGSQQMFDWYSPSHLLHGILFYFALSFLPDRVSFGWRLFIAMLIEAAWEIVENTNAVIERYREVTISLDYYGDSVLNSIFDMLAMVMGFWLAGRLPVWASIAIVIGFEVLTMAIIRDGLALNIIMLIAPLDAIRDWQAGG
jgi:hypothetical protein